MSQQLILQSAKAKLLSLTCRVTDFGSWSAVNLTASTLASQTDKTHDLCLVIYEIMTAISIFSIDFPHSETGVISSLSDRKRAEM